MHWLDKPLTTGWLKDVKLDTTKPILSIKNLDSKQTMAFSDRFQLWLSDVFYDSVCQLIDASWK